MRNIFLICLLIVSHYLGAQNKPATTFFGTSTKDVSVCENAGSFMNEKQVEDLVTLLLSKIGTKNRYIIKSCTQVENCQAYVFEGRPYILYNPEFLGRVKQLKFTEATIPSIANRDWETLTILAHELGHHLNNHATNPKPGITLKETELEADYTAGFIIYLVGGSLAQAQLAYKTIPETEGGTHPGRQKRIESVARGWNTAQANNPMGTGGGGKVKPLVNNDPNAVSDLDGNVYSTVKIGRQVWMAQNLNTSQFRNGNKIKEAKNKVEWEEAGYEQEPAWCYYQFNPAFAEKYGKLYNWYAVDDTSGLAPEGWHIPTSFEWDDLSVSLGGDATAGGKLKGILYWSGADSTAFNSSGFSGIPAGGLNKGQFIFLGKSGIWWTSSEMDSYFARARSVGLGSAKLLKTKDLKESCFSVRCIKDLDE